MKITKQRWAEAQEFELNDWKNEQSIVEKEWEEAHRKYNDYFRYLENKLEVSDLWKILDVGCNLTCISRMIEKGEHYGVEPLADALEMDSQVPDVKIVQGMGEDMPFDDNFFDLVVCRNVIDHTMAPEGVVKECFRVLKPGGYLILASYVYNPFITITKNFGELISIFRNVGHPHTYTMRGLEALARDNGYFEILENKSIYIGKSPNDFGKIDEAAGNLSTVEKLVLFVNDNILRYTWFVREYSLLCKAKK
jgi:SAM-dependent methyltransferase